MMQSNLVIDNTDLPKQKGGCDLAPIPTKEKRKDEIEAEKLGVSVGKYNAMLDYAKQLRRTYPKMTANKITMRVKQKFNIKLT